MTAKVKINCNSKTVKFHENLCEIRQKKYKQMQENQAHAGLLSVLGRHFN